MYLDFRKSTTTLQYLHHDENKKSNKIMYNVHYEKVRKSAGL